LPTQGFEDRQPISRDLAAYELEPQLVTSLFDAEQRSKRSLVKYDDIPKMMVDARHCD